MAEAVLEFNDTNFDSDVLKSGSPVLVDFWAPWCGPCKMVGPIVEELAGEYKDQVKVGKMNVDENPATPTNFGIRSIPTVMLFNNGELVDKIIGAVPKATIEDLIKKVL